jgi:hypothetical protein
MLCENGDACDDEYFERPAKPNYLLLLGVCYRTVTLVLLLLAPGPWRSSWSQFEMCLRKCKGRCV